MPFFLVSFLDPDTKEPICADPRGVLKQVVERAGSKGWQCYAGCEYEVGSRFNSSMTDTKAANSTSNSKVVLISPFIISVPL